MKNFTLVLLVVVCAGFFKQAKTPASVVVVHEMETIEKRLRIAVVDTGISDFQVKKPYMCKDVAYVTESKNNEFDKNGHGTNVIGLIGSQIDVKKYCITSYGTHNWQYMAGYLKMLDIATQEKPFAINLSWASEGFSFVEFELLKQLSDNGTVIVTAAGNKAVKLTKDKCETFPACNSVHFKKNFYVIGMIDDNKTNWGPVISQYYVGNNIGFPLKTGSSQSAANFTGHLFSK